MTVTLGLRRDVFETKSGPKELPCACNDEALCAYHWALEKRDPNTAFGFAFKGAKRNNKQDLEEFYVRPAREEKPGRGRGGGAGKPVGDSDLRGSRERNRGRSGKPPRR
jgi:hypothetical protein